MKINLKSTETLILRTVAKDQVSRNDFRWPKRGPVECPDWKPTKECGNGLHGALMGEGSGTLFDWNADALWQVVKVAKADLVDLGGKVKFPRGYVVFTGDRKAATDIVCDHGGIAVIGAMRTVDDGKTVVVGHKGTATAGNGGTAIAGYKGTATAGYRGTATAGDGGTATAGNGGTATAGDGGTAIAGYRGTATAGDGGTATAGYGGTAIAGYEGTAIAGNGGTATAGVSGKIQINHYDGSRMRTLVGYIGEDGLLPDTKYRVSNGKFVKL